MWRAIRIIVLLFILATVAQAAWLARVRTADWGSSLTVAIYPINGDGSETADAYIRSLRAESFGPIEEFMKAEAARHGLDVYRPVEVKLAPVVTSRPPAPPHGAGKPSVVLWSLNMRYWAYFKNTLSGTRPDVRIFVLYFDPKRHPRLAHSTGLQQGLIGVVNAFASEEMAGSNMVIIVHELMHTLGATDKYDFAGNRPLYPDGYADARQDPLHPQAYAEIMAGRIPISPARSEIPEGLHEVVVGEKTAREINWTR